MGQEKYTEEDIFTIICKNEKGKNRGFIEKLTKKSIILLNIFIHKNRCFSSQLWKIIIFFFVFVYNIILEQTQVDN